jgi:hypothetical protein
MGFGSRPGQGTGLLSSSANFTHSERWARVIGVSGTPFTISALGSRALTTGAVADRSLGVTVDDEQAARAVPATRAATSSDRGLTG